MTLVRTVPELRAAVRAARDRGATVGFVPTMGFLHDGHLSLLDAAREAGSTFIVVSIFVNPAQFGPREDFARYPRDEKRDTDLLEKKSADLIFLPSVEEIYPSGSATTVKTAGAASPLEGERRPGHFDGVATVVLKLFHMVEPDLAVFGQKDAQQCAVVRQLVDDLNLPVRLVIAPTARESDGLAMSSRNVYLNAEQRAVATTLHKALEAGRAALLEGLSLEAIESRMSQTAERVPQIEVDYLRLVDPKSFEAPETLARDLILVGAVRIGTTRLIDNIPVRRFEMPCRSSGTPRA